MKRIASELGVSPRTAYNYLHNKVKKPRVEYESLRNLSRRATYKYAREHFISPEEASKSRRQAPFETYQKATEQDEWFNHMVDDYYQYWNDTRKKGSPKISRDEVARRIQKGIDSGKSRIEIENY